MFILRVQNFEQCTKNASNLVKKMLIFKDKTNEKGSAGMENDLNIYKKALEVVPMPVIMVAPDNTVLFINKSYCEFLGVAQERVIGRSIYEIIENSRMPLIMKTQKVEYADRHKYTNGKAKGKEIIVHRIPIVENGVTIGSFAMLAFTSIADLTALAEKNQKIDAELDYYKSKILELQSSKYSLDNIIGSSEVIRDLKENIVKVATLKQTVLITGESGVGKELIAHSIHNCSDRHERMFVRVNCAAIPDNLFESEFFGYVGGSFSGASKTGKIGKFELANNGTLFLDEIGEMPLFMQSKLLRTLQEKEITRVGGNDTIPVDVRIIAATNRDLEKMVKEGMFREDLYYRINILNIKAPALREHPEDIPELADNILKELHQENGVAKSLSKEVYAVFKHYNWPGNVRELNNILSKMYFMSNGNEIISKDIPRHIRYGDHINSLSANEDTLDKTIEELEKQMVLQTLKKTEGNLTKTASILKISRPRLYRILEKIPKEEIEKEV